MTTPTPLTTPQLSGATPVKQEDVTFQNGAVTLTGTLLLPQRDRRCPGVVLAHGSGDDDREGYRVFAQHFAERGIAALIYDKRGVGASTGSWRKGTFAELAEDALAGLHLLAQRSEVDSQRIGLWGVSEGGWVAPLAALHAAEARFLIAISAAGMSPARQELYRRRLVIYEASSSRLVRAARMAGIHAMFGALRHAPKSLLPGIAGYFGRTMDYDPTPVWKAITQPILLVFGAEDESVPPQESANLIANALKEAGHQDYTIRIFPGGNHGIRYLDEETQQWTFAPGYLDMVADWILAR